ncbi:hypothetical protein LCGC14_2547930 [marine sediment metagenome]|uniref:Uncharacterized protein n=1 Tax=marine sediment metagenome TaxID=412755 RepID=A0A0F9BBM6_9ZZZZ
MATQTIARELSPAQREERRLARIEVFNRQHVRNLRSADPPAKPEGVKYLSGILADAVTTLSPVLNITVNDLNTAFKTALKHVSHSATVPDREDIIQMLAVRMLAQKPPTGGFATVVCRDMVRNWNKAFHRRQHLSLDDTPEDTEADVYVDVLVGKVEFEAELASDMDARELFQSLEPSMRLIVTKKMRGAPLSGKERVILHRYRRSMNHVFTPTTL